jgi:hypothetical protein
MKRINVMLDPDLNIQAVRKAKEKLGIGSLSALLRYLQKKFMRTK